MRVEAVLKTAGRQRSDGRLFLHRDQSFSLRWMQGCGGTLWLDCQTTIRHTGLHIFEDRYSDKLQDDFPSPEI
ncbi:hypothetical protein [Roseibium sp. LAB1]